MKTTPAVDRLKEFNQQVLQHQDDAFTLAWFLLGDEAKAEAAVQAAVLQVFRQNRLVKNSFQLRLLQAVVQFCQQPPLQPLPATGKGGPPAPLEMLQSLPARERQVLVLIDLLDLRYSEAAAVTGQTETEVRLVLSQARRSLSGSRSAAQAGVFPLDRETSRPYPEVFLPKGDYDGLR